MRLGLDISQHQLTWEELLARVRFAEEAGFTGAWVFDHFKPLYGDPAGPCLEAWTLLAALGSATKRIRLGTLVSGVTYRHPAVLAAGIVTVDHASAGRLDIGMGAAWFQAEHQMFGIEFPPIGERVARLDEALQVIDGLLTRDDVTFDGRYYTLKNATYRPRPVQQPRPPIWVGAGGTRMIEITARRADVWHSFGSVAELERKAALLDEKASQAGRDPSTILRSTNLSLSQSWDDLRRTTDQLAAAGFSYLIVSWPSEGRARLDEFVDRVMPELLATGPPDR
jgi:F420-dependent oxidoreductase-like protein